MPATTTRRVYDLRPAQGAWEVRSAEENPRRFERKAEALTYAREAARSHRPSQLRIHGSNGRIQTEHTYGGDPRRSRG